MKHNIIIKKRNLEQQKRKNGMLQVAVFMSVIVFLPLLAYFSYNNRKALTNIDPHDQYAISDVHNSPADSLGQITEEQKASALHQKISTAVKSTTTSSISSTNINKPKKIVSKASDTEVDLTGVLNPSVSISSSSLQNINGTMLNIKTPVLGPIPTNGIQPLYGIKHTGGDAIFALACNYPKNFYQRFAGSLRKSGFTGDIVLAVSPEYKMKPGVAAYIKKVNIIGYAFDVDCIGIDNCKLKDDFLGYPDPRPHRTFANIRYALYEYWLRYYTPTSYILILDFRDTFFQADPFGHLPALASRTPKFDLWLFAENWKVKTIGKCVYNSLWIGRCFGKPATKALKDYAVICSGSTMGSYIGIEFYVETMLKSMDSVKCWLKGIESDQGYQNYLYYKGFFNTSLGSPILYYQGEGPVNTIGALNGKRVPANMKGPLDTFWKIRDKDGYILNNDGTKSACVHQWDRWYKDLWKFVDTKLYKDPSKKYE